MRQESGPWRRGEDPGPRCTPRPQRRDRGRPVGVFTRAEVSLANSQALELPATEGFGSLPVFLHFTRNPQSHLPAALSAERTYFGDCQEAADTTRLCQYSRRFCSLLPPHPLPGLPSGPGGRRQRRPEERVGVGEDQAQNKQVLQLVAYIAGGPDVSQEAPRRLSTLSRRVSLPLKKLWDRGGGAGRGMGAGG